MIAQLQVLELGRAPAAERPGAVTVLRTFLFTHGGVRRHLQPGEVIATIPPGALPGLIAGGFVQKLQPVGAVSPPVIDDAGKVPAETRAKKPTK